MASATLNSNLMEALVSRPVEARRVNARSSSREGFISPAPSSPPSSSKLQNFLRENQFQSSYSQYIVEQELQDNSTSGGDATTEDEEVPENLSYFFNKSADDTPHASLKKRRKQMKPNRVSSFEEKCDKPSTSEKNSFFSEMSRSVDFETHRCPHCPFDTLSEDDLRHHIIEDHLGRMLTEEGIKNSYSNSLNEISELHSGRNFSYQDKEEGELVPLNLSSPKWDRRRSTQSQLREDGEKSPDPEVSLPSSLHLSPTYTDGKFRLPSLVPLGPPPFLLPFLQQPNVHSDRDRLHPTQQPLRPVSNGQSQIFNLEAYCDLCNKEFCNKYFLKTHKANKHGIFSSDLCTSQLSLSTPIAPSSPQPSLISSSVANSTSLASPSLQTSPLNSLQIPGPSFAGAFIAASMSNLPLRPLLPPHLHGLHKTALSIPKNDAVGSHPKNGIANIEAYCEICQKEFCNKYFLKRHKGKIHNIDIEVTIKNTAKSPLSLGKPYDRPDGWCDACRKNVGTKNDINNHKLNVHGPHIIIPMTSPKDQDSISDSRENLIESNKISSSSESINENFSPWDQKREDAARAEVNNQSIKSVYFEEEREKNYGLDRERYREDLKDKKEYWEGRERNERECRKESLEEENSSPKYFTSLQEEEKVLNSLLIKEELQQYSEVQSNKSLIRNSEGSDPGLEREFTMQQLSQILINQNYSVKAEIEKEESKYLDSTEDKRNSQTPMRDTTSEQPRTPGAGSSNDENSRELGLVNRIDKLPNIPILPDGAKLSHEQLRQLGVVNPDAFCELCCKEFCNKYFLRTHKSKKHGIFTPEFSDRSRHIKEHGSPLNLAKILERQALEMRSGFPEFEVDMECDVCHRQFPNVCMLQMHKFYVHGPGQEILQHEQLLQMQQQPFQQEQFRQLALQAQQQTLQSQVKNSQLSPARTKSDFVNEQIALNSISQVNKILMNEAVDSRTKGLISRPNSETGSSNMPQLSPSEMLNRNSATTEMQQEQDTSEDLKKLQSMILDLNKCGDGGGRCKMCQQDLGNKYLLRAHLMTDHGIFPKTEGSILSCESHTPKTSREGTPVTSPYSNPVNDGQGYCNICKKDYFAKYLLQQHTLQAHGIFTPHSAPSFIERIKAEIDSRDERKAISTSRSYCEICNKELCNKYFMKTHMQKMHGINIENPTPGGVTCDICRKDLCSKYFLRVHKQNTHGLVEDHGENEVFQHEDGSNQTCPICSRRFKNFKWLQTHLSTDHGEIGKEMWKDMERRIPSCETSQPNLHSCNLCGHQLNDLVSLQIHKIRTHGVTLEELNGPEFAHKDEEKQIFQCSSCTSSFTNATLLCTHEKSHSSSTLSHSISSFLPSQVHEFQCTLCTHTVPTLELYQQHLLQHQLQVLKPFFDKEDEAPSTNETTSETVPNKVDIVESVSVVMKERTSTPKTAKKRWKCYTCGLNFKSRNHCVMHVQTKHKSKTLIGSAICRRRLFKCKVCGGTAKSRSTLKRHLKSHYNPLLCRLPTDRWQQQQRQQTSAQGGFVMQPFMLNKEDEDSSFSEEQPFVPSLVYLPVVKKVDRPLKVSFCLTPAENKAFE